MSKITNTDVLRNNLTLKLEEMTVDTNMCVIVNYEV
jgi:hypothetical protein